MSPPRKHASLKLGFLITRYEKVCISCGFMVPPPPLCRSILDAAVCKLRFDGVVASNIFGLWQFDCCRTGVSYWKLFYLLELLNFEYRLVPKVCYII